MSFSISFENIDLLTNGGFRCSVVSSKYLKEEPDELMFEMSPKPDRLTSDQIALALSTLCGRAYASIRMDLHVSENCAKTIEAYTQAELTFAGRGVLASRREGREYLLNFSGGFDSLAALSLMPESTRLVSNDWGGNFSREAEFFKRFPTNILKTNAQRLGYCRDSWQFMGLAMILFADHLDIGYSAFGGILEASWQQFLRRPPKIVSIYPFKGLGIRSMCVVNGLTEVATAMLAVKYYPEIVCESLMSVAGAGSEKLRRRYLFADYANRKFGLKLDFPTTGCPVKFPLKFGSHLAMDFLSAFMVKQFSYEVASEMLTDVPHDIVEFAKTHSLRFYERLNTNFLDTIPEEVRPRYFSQLVGAGILPYDEEDWLEFNDMRQLLTKWYPQLKR